VFTVDTCVDWDVVSGGDVWFAYVLIVERSETRAPGFWGFGGVGDDWVVWVPLELWRPSAGGMRPYSWTWRTKPDASAGRAFEARIWLVREGDSGRFTSAWSSTAGVR
jgi:hypothetical protein